MSIQKKPLITEMFTADPSAHEFDGKIYIYPSHDIPHNGEDNDNGDEYQMEDYHVFRMDDENTLPVDCGLALSYKDVPWVSEQMWAPDAVRKNGQYYLVFPARDKDGNFRLGIATSKVPEGPFTPQPECIKGSFSIDPCAFHDEDDKVYMCFGGLWGGQLEKYRTGSFDPNGTEPEKDAPAVCPKIALMQDDMLEFAEEPRDIVILDENGEPIKAGDEDRRYFEDPWMYKYNGKYYFSYSTGTTHYLVYAEADNPYGPFTYKGRIMEPVLGWTTHHSVMEYKGKWYLFYHDCELSKGINHRRNVKFVELNIDENGKIETIIP